MKRWLRLLDRAEEWMVDHGDAIAGFCVLVLFYALLGTLFFAGPHT